MTTVKRIFADYRAAGSLEGLVQLDSVVDDRTFLTRSGQLLSVLKARPQDAECLDEATLERTTRAFEAAARSLDGQFRLRQYVLKRPFSVPQPGRYRNIALDDLVRARSTFLVTRHASLFSIDTYLVLTHFGWQIQQSSSARFRRFVERPSSFLRELFSAEAATTAIDAELLRARERLEQKADALVVQLRDSFPLSVCSVDQGFAFFRRLLNYSPSKSDGVPLRYPHSVGFQAADSALECYRDHLRLDNYYVKTLVLKDLPAQTTPQLWGRLLELPSSFILATDWVREDDGRMRALIQSKRRHFFNSRASLLSHLNSAPTGTRDSLIDSSAVAHVDALGSCLEEIEVHGRHYGAYSLAIVLYDQNFPVLARSVAECFKVFAAHDARVIEERYNLLNAWLSVIPGDEAYCVRSQWLLNSHHADLSFLFAPAQGESRNHHLGREHLAVLETENGTPFFFNLHVQDVAHALVLGATGSGKSFLLNFIVSFLQRYEPRTLIFDLGGSYRSITRAFGGAYVSVGEESLPFSINPFSLPASPEHLHFLHGFVRTLIESGDYAMSGEDDRDLAQQIDALYGLEPEHRRLSTLAQILARPLRAPLERWVATGPYARWFDNLTDTVTLARFQTFDFEGLQDYPQVLEPLVFYILHRATLALNDANLVGVYKTFVLDEAWRFFRHPAIKAYVAQAAKTWRKKNAGLIVATQSLDDLRSSEMLGVLIESCPTQLFLANPGMDRAAYRDVFRLNDTEVDRIGALIPKKQFLLRQPHLSKVLNLNVDSKSHALFSGHDILEGAPTV